MHHSGRLGADLQKISKPFAQPDTIAERESISSLGIVEVTTAGYTPALSVMRLARGPKEGAREAGEYFGEKVIRAARMGAEHCHILYCMARDMGLELALWLTGFSTGLVYGAISAPTASEVESVEQTIVRTLNEMNAQRLLANSVRSAFHKLTSPLTIPVQIRGPDGKEDQVQIPNTMLEVTPVAIGLRPDNNPPLRFSTSLPVRLREIVLVTLTRVSDNTLLDEWIIKLESEEHPYKDWSKNSGKLLVTTVTQFHERIADDIVHRLSNPPSETKSLP